MPPESKAQGSQDDAQLREIDALVQQANAGEVSDSGKEPDEASIARELGISMEELRDLRDTTLG